jgi:hypothetical protein
MTSNGKTNRLPPAYQEYASDMLANSRYRTMTLAERGLMDTMRRECWFNGSVPKEPQELATYLGKPVEDISLNLSIRVLSFFRERHDQLICPELDAYKAELEIRTKKMSEGGQKGGKATQIKNKVVKATLEAMVKPLSRDELSGGEVSRDEKKSLGEGITLKEIDEWNAEYDSTPETSNAYYQATKGGH